MNSISVCMIVKDEEKALSACLRSVKAFADEIIIVDTGSIDRTVEIASRYTDQIFHFDWKDDFSAARNFSFSKASCDYIMWLDADDIVLETDIMKIWDFKLSKPSNVDVFLLKYVTTYDKDYRSLFCFYRERIVKRSGHFQWHDPVHEVIIPRGNITYTDISIYHQKKKPIKKDRNLNIYRKFLANGNKLTPRQHFYYARELFFNDEIDEAIHEFSLFLSEKKGWVENNIEACLNLARCYEMKGQYENALTALFGSFCMAKPRGEILCEIGQVYMALKRYDEAIYWYELAKKMKPNLKSGAFVNLECYHFLPNLQLCACYYHKGQYKRAKRFHEKAKKIHPDNSSVQTNEKIFSSLS